MSVVERILEIASRVSTPLALGGLVVGALFLTFRQILALNIYPRLSREAGGQIILKIINAFLALALVATVLGFVAYVLPTVMNAYYPKLERDYVDIGTDEDQPLEAVVRAAAAGRNVTINFSADCGADVRRAVVEAGDHDGKDMRDFLEKLKERVRGRAVNYSVVQEGERRYEIVCR